MKKLLIVLLNTLLITNVSIYAQRRTATKDVRISEFKTDAIQTYSYIVENGEQILDGPVSVKGGVGSATIPFKTFYTATISDSYNLNANHSMGKLHGALSMKYNRTVKSTNGESASHSMTYNGNFSKGMPHGVFSVNAKLDAKYISNLNANLTFNNGVLTGPFRFKYAWLGYYKDFNGSFTKDGKFDGTWAVERKLESGSGCDIYQFKNGVLIGGDFMSTDAKIKSLSLQYANGTISLKELIQQGYTTSKQRFKNVFSNNDDLYGLIAYRLFKWGVINFSELGELNMNAQDANSYYEIVVPIPYLSDNDTKRLLENISSSTRPYTIIGPDQVLIKENGIDDLSFVIWDISSHDYKMECSIPAITIYREGWEKEVYCLTSEQEKKITEFFDERNKRAAEEFKKYLEKTVSTKRLYLNSDTLRREYVLSATAYDISYTEETNDPRHRGEMVPQAKGHINYGVPGRPYSTYACDINTSLYNHNLIIKATNFVRVTNIFDKIYCTLDSFRLVSKQIYNIHTQIEGDSNLAENENIKRHKEMIHKLYIAPFSISFEHPEETFAKLEKEMKYTLNYKSFIQLYAKIEKLNVEIVNEGITKYTTDSVTSVDDWTFENDGKALEAVVEQKDKILADLKFFKKSKPEVENIHASIHCSEPKILVEYNTLYSSLINEFTTVEKSIENINKLINTQKEILEYIALYDNIVANNKELPKRLSGAKTLVSAYKNYYKQLDFTWKDNANSIDTMKSILALQSEMQNIAQRATLKDDEKIIKQNKDATLDEIIEAYKNL